MSSLDIIVVNWNTGQHLRNCLQSVIASERNGFTISRAVVVDNASVDQSADGLDDLTLPLVVVRNNQNRGFAAACNQGAKKSTADYLLFLNPDTKLFGDSLSRVLAFMEAYENRDVGIAGVQLLEESGAIARTCAKFPSPRKLFSEMIGLDRLFPSIFDGHFMATWDHRTSRDVDQVMGAFFLVRRSLFEILNGFDEQFFVYYEDLDFSLRARQLGFRSYYFSEAKAFHKGKASSDLNKSARLSYVLQSRILYSYKHFTRLAATLILLSTFLVEPFFRLGFSALRRSGSSSIEIGQGYGRLWKMIPEILSNVRGRER